METNIKGKFITLEGVDGAGKSTHLEWICNYLRGLDRPPVLTREPGGTPLGEKLRALLLSEPMHPETEALLMFAARREHLAQIIEPALAEGKWVVSDRFTDASFAYQCGGRGIPAARLAQLESWVHGHLQPDLTLLFDVPLETARERLQRNASLDRFEQEQEDFFIRVRAVYLERARQSPERIRIIDSSRPVDIIQAELKHILDSILKNA